MTPRIPNKGLVETSAGIAAAAARAICAAVGGRDMTVEAAILTSRADSSDNRKARAQLTGQGGIVERDLDGDSLYYLGEIAGGVVGRQQRKLRPAGGGDLYDFAMDHLARILVDADLCRITNSYVRKLCLFVICFYPFRAIDERNHLRARRHQLPGADLPFAYAPVIRRIDLRVAKVHLGYDQ